VNPTLNYGSIVCLKVIDIKKDYDDLTMSISNNILGMLAGDYDGDVLNIIALMDKELVDALVPVFNPRLMIIDKNNRKFNREMNLIKDQMIGLYAFAED